MSARPLSNSDLRREGLRILLDRLGPADTIRFLQQFDIGAGDYTQERGQWLDGLTPDELFEAIQRRQHSSQDV